MARYDLDGKVALVTGGARGIGLATARALQARGAKVAIVDLEPSTAFDLALVADVTDFDAMAAAVDSVVERFGGLDVGVANAGIATRVGTARGADPEVFERIIAVNLLGVWRTVRAALPQVTARGGHVVVIASIYAFSNGMGTAAYAMAKAGVEQLGHALRVELVQHGASARVAYFGFIDTEMVHESIDRDPLADRLRATIPRVLQKRLPPRAAGEAIVRGIEHRRARIIRPRRWAVLSVLRGVLNPLIQARAERDPAVQSLLAEVDARRR